MKIQTSNYLSESNGYTLLEMMIVIFLVSLLVYSTSIIGSNWNINEPLSDVEKKVQKLRLEAILSGKPVSLNIEKRNIEKSNHKSEFVTAKELSDENHFRIYFTPNFASSGGKILNPLSQKVTIQVPWVSSGEEIYDE